MKIKIYVVAYRPEHRATIGNARESFFANKGPPASTLVGASALAMPEWLIEIEGVAVVELVIRRGFSPFARMVR